MGDLGPRHIDFHPSGKFAYVINEQNNTLTACAYDAEKGRLAEIRTVPTLPPVAQGMTSYTADVHVLPSGKFVYGSNRGHDSIAIFSIDTATGEPTPIGHEPTQGSQPRNFHIDPGGKLMLVVNVESDNIVAFHIDAATGTLTETGVTTVVPSPSYVGVVYLARD